MRIQRINHTCTLLAGTTKSHASRVADATARATHTAGTATARATGSAARAGTSTNATAG